MKPTDAFLADLRALLGKYPELSEGAIDEAHANADDSGNFNDTLDRGINLGERLLAEEVGGLLTKHELQ
ncbi:hypothetical protein RSP795_10280 [Ralstonia solanacearum]|uniref:hypothetical protein n=1 Tax=Ralstonia solanacearum TaxID=305 RepID=UPI0007D83A69|nr:hypothetical protein [Ralstonia solanacearum]OAI62816.1 hypothetical protein RSP795_10280 [Ralstonia solanacearum]